MRTIGEISDGVNSPYFIFPEDRPVVLVLSTGRCGTETLSALCAAVPSIRAVHQPEPLTFGLGKIAYLEGHKSEVNRVLEEAMYTCRREALRQALGGGVGYVETSPQVTFMAPYWQKLVPEARFLHVVRDPRPVIRSGMRRDWYAGNFLDRTRLEPRGDDHIAERWASMPPLHRIAWCWAETNRFISRFISTLLPARRLTLRSEDIFAAKPNTIEALFQFLSVETPSNAVVNGVLEKKLNAQVRGDFPSIEEWDLEMLDVVKRYAGNTARKIGYEF